MQQLREALKILAERVLILEHMSGVHGEERPGDLTGRPTTSPRNTDVKLFPRSLISNQNVPKQLFTVEIT